MQLKKVTYFDRPGVQPRVDEEDGQAKPNVFGVRWVNADTFETIRVRGGARTGPHGEVLQPVEPTLDLTAWVTAKLEKTAKPHK